MSAASNLRSEDQFLCCICLDVFTDPVSTPCGHNFCKNCISQHWDLNQSCQCPMCKETFNTRPQLRVNTFISEMVAQFRREAQQKASSSSSEQQAAKPGEVPCDVCTGTRLKALKSCLVCQTSYCQTHLEPHLTKEAPKRHQLIDAVENLEGRMCTKHDKLFEAELKRVQHYAVDVTLDPDTAHPKLILSDDGKQVFDSDVWKNLPDNPERFSQYVCVLGEQSFSSGRFYFEVQVKGKTDWTLGVARESINRKGKIIARPQDGFWTVWLRNENEYKACAGPSVRLCLQPGPEKVGVFVDYEDGLVSFYDVGAAALIYSFTGCSFTHKLHPFFGPSLNDGGKNSAPLIICPVNQTESIND
ncbi:nuclear factor 7, brain-like [Oreochromis aureus]|uniref:nuclear factor 7, brain-like n=1 Tax=Oreochromis aureus TaxID=47969 RepID=UPI001954DCDE|nr:nuclear factor 7, brain-like [Oreochromis aureus]